MSNITTYYLFGWLFFLPWFCCSSLTLNLLVIALATRRNLGPTNTIVEGSTSILKAWICYEPTCHSRLIWKISLIDLKNQSYIFFWKTADYREFCAIQKAHVILKSSPIIICVFDIDYENFEYFMKHKPRDSTIRLLAVGIYDLGKIEKLSPFFFSTKYRNWI